MIKTKKDPDYIESRPRRDLMITTLKVAGYVAAFPFIDNCASTSDISVKTGDYDISAHYTKTMSPEAKAKYLNDRDVIKAYDTIDFFGWRSSMSKDAKRVLERKAAYYESLFPNPYNQRDLNIDIRKLPSPLENKLKYFRIK